MSGGSETDGSSEAGGRSRRLLAALRRAFWAVDRSFDGADPPPRPLVFAARNAAGCATVAALLVAAPVGLALSVFTDPAWGHLLQTVLTGTCAWLLFWAFLRFERRRQAHYERTGYDLAPRDSGTPAGPRAVLTGLLVSWIPMTVCVWLIGRLDDAPPSWPDSAVLAALFAVCMRFADHLRERRRTRARKAADREAR
ncbi:hypothetical protein [Streptomyces hokutonensis]|uniref:hypothetical protein n=1 Tax=Streptomyces hokutonensis TaxID=1306990 RepID=UPI0003637B64|nr:hypothetical protein [Streptomyces hokutonensis]